LGSVTPAHAERLGQALGTVHLATPSLEPIAAGRFDVAGLQQRLATVVGVSVAVAADAERISAELAKVAASRDSALPTGITHGDLFRDNVLWDGLELTALLDFESACRGVFIYDLMVCVLAWCYRDGFELGLVCGC
jgi:homoserine kinase type II